MSSPAPAENPAGDAPPPPQPSTTEGDVDLDAEMADTQANTSATANGATSNPDQEMQDTQPAPAAAQQNRKDATLREFMSKMDDYAPIVSSLSLIRNARDRSPILGTQPLTTATQIPDAVIAHYLTLAGLPPPSAADPTGATTNTTPLPLARLLGLATQKFIADIAADAYQFSRIRAGGSASTTNALGNAAMGGAAGAGGGAVGGGGAGGAAGGAGKGAQNTSLGVQRSGFGGGGTGGSGQGKTVLTMEDLGMAVQEYGVNVKRGEFYR